MSSSQSQTVSYIFIIISSWHMRLIFTFLITCEPPTLSSWQSQCIFVSISNQHFLCPIFHCLCPFFVLIWLTWEPRTLSSGPSQYIFINISNQHSLCPLSSSVTHLGASYVLKWCKGRWVGRLKNCTNISFGIFHDNSKQSNIFTLKTALSLISEFCLKIDWCLMIEELANWVLDTVL